MAQPPNSTRTPPPLHPRVISGTRGSRQLQVITNRSARRQSPIPVFNDPPDVAGVMSDESRNSESHDDFIRSILPPHIASALPDPAAIIEFQILSPEMF